MISSLLRSTIGQKFLMAVTGVGLLLFATGHMIGNLQIFLGPHAINRYAHFLQSNTEILWPVRIGLLAFVAVHVVTSILLTLKNRSARTKGYRVKEVVAAGLASRTMIVTGLVLAAYVVYHLLHFTTGSVDPTFETLVDPDTGYHDVYRMMVIGFSVPANSIAYLAAMALLGFHLSHGVAAMFQSLGLKNQVYDRCIKRLARILAIGLFIGYSAVPVAVLLGWVK